MSGTKFIISFEARPDASASLAQMLAQATQALQQAQGCKGARLFSAEDNPCRFTLMEDWESKSAHQAHVSRIIAAGTWARIASHLAQDPVGHYVNEL